MKTLRRLKEVYIDYIDPQAEILILAARTAIAAAISLLLFYYFFDENAAIWGAFASFFIVQTDINATTNPEHRGIFMLTVTIIFALLAIYGCYIGKHSIWGFSFSMLAFSLVTGWLNNFSIKYWNGAIWGLIVFLFAGSVAWQTTQPLVLGGIFFSGGMIAWVICAISAPSRPIKRFKLDLNRTIYKLRLMLVDMLCHHSSDQRLYEKQILAALQIQQNTAVDLMKNTCVEHLLVRSYQLFVLTKSLTLSFKKLPQEYPQYNSLVENMLRLVINLLDALSQPHLKDKLAAYQQDFEKLRENLLKNDRAVLMYYADCFFKIKLLGAQLREFSSDYQHLVKIT